MEVVTKSPVVVTKTTFDKGKKLHYLSPKDAAFSSIVETNILHKCKSIQLDEHDNEYFECIPAGHYKAVQTRYKKGVITGYTGRFILKGSRNALKTALCSGLGAKNGQGFGFVVKL